MRSPFDARLDPTRVAGSDAEALPEILLVGANVEKVAVDEEDKRVWSTLYDGHPAGLARRDVSPPGLLDHPSRRDFPRLTTCYPI